MLVPPCSPMQFKSFLIDSWNIRGLGDDHKCSLAYADILVARPQIIALQETKLSSISPAKAASFSPPNLRSFYSINAVGTAGGILTAWDPNFFSLTNSFTTDHVLSSHLSLTSNSTTIRISNVYAPCDHASKAAFLDSLSTH
jgi:exonuclease III